MSQTYRRCELNPHELRNSHHHISHFCLGDLSVTIEVIHTECPVELLIEGAVQQGGEGHQHVLEQGKHLSV